MKVMKTLLKKIRAKKYVNFDQRPLKRLKKLRKWMNHINPTFKLDVNVNC